MEKDETHKEKGPSAGCRMPGAGRRGGDRVFRFETCAENALSLSSPARSQK